jgi:Ni2+-binding GTPase involved in maturation of urease and hydrogenase
MLLNLTGGFLGSGKTTAIAGACRQLMAANRTVGVITNDQGEQQVDTLSLENLDIPVREVANGCFCCNYDQLDAHIRSLELQRPPDVLFAESVGTCTDLIATVAKPLNLDRPDISVVISVFADAAFLASLLEGTSLFIEETVRYIYRKQLEEADLLIINKVDLIRPPQRERIAVMLASEYPGKTVLYQNSRKDSDITRWIELTGSCRPARRVSLELDYAVYGAGEARLAWLDKRISIVGQGGAVVIARRIMDGIFRRIQEQRLFIGHLKFFVETERWKKKISFTPSTTDFPLLPDDRDIRNVNIVINARVQTDPQLLTGIVDEVIERASRSGNVIIPGDWSAFVPGYPRPARRIVGE